MARIRTVKPAFFSSITIGGLKIPTRLTFVGLWTYVDDAGRGVDDARLIKAELWPLDDTYSAKKVEADLEAMAKADLIERYVVDGRRYLRVRGWSEHQKINKPQPSKLPPSPDEVLNGHGDVPTDEANDPPPDRDSSGNGPGTVTEASPLEGKGREGNRKGREVSSIPEVGSPPGDSPCRDENFVTAVATILGTADYDRAAERQTIDHPNRYLERCIRTRRAQHAADIATIRTAHPDWTVERVATELDRADHPETATAAGIPDHAQTQAAIDAQRAHDQHVADEAQRADQAIAALDDHQRTELRTRAEAEVQPIAGRRPEVFITAAMRRLALDQETS